MAINIDNITNNVVQDLTNKDNIVVNGTGIFDKLMKTINTHIDAQFDSGRLVGKDFATVYLGALQSTLSASLQFELEKDGKAAQDALLEAQRTELLANGLVDRALKTTQQSELVTNGTSDRALKASQKLKVDGETGLIPKQSANLDAQNALYVRQKEGFDDNANQKVLDSMINGWSLAYASGTLTTAPLPSFINDDVISTAINRVYASTNIGDSLSAGIDTVAGVTPAG